MNLMINKDIHYKELTEEEKKKLQKVQYVKSFIMVTIGSLIYSIGVIWILRLGGFFSGGITGTSQLIVGLFEKFSTNEVLVKRMGNNLGTFVLLLNIPLLLFGWRGVSKRFALLTLASIVIQTITMNLLSTFTISPFVNLLNNGNGVGGGIIDIIKSATFSIAKTTDNVLKQDTFYETMSVGTRLILAIAGGTVCGVGASLCLKGGGSSGGTDIIANYLQVKKQVPFTKYQSIVDATIIILSSLISVENVLFTLIRLAVYVKTINAIYHIYRTNRIEVVTTNGEAIREALLKSFNHSMTLYRCVGGYTNCGKEAIVIYASSYEINIYINIIKDCDPNAFITITKAKVEKSNYIQKTIV